MKNQLILSTLLLTILSLHPALAQDGSGDRREMIKQKMQERLQQMDTDGDGNLSKGEFMAQAEARFNKMDGNGDGIVTPDEQASIRDHLKQGAGSGGFGGKQFP